MAKSAQEKFNEFLEESRSTSQAVSAVTTASYELYGNYAYACGFLESMIKDVIAELPKKRREEVRAQFLARSRKLEQEKLVDILSN
jgi:hypothetical protein